MYCHNVINGFLPVEPNIIYQIFKGFSIHLHSYIIQEWTLKLLILKAS